MFYEESKILEVLRCKNCNKKLDEPKQLPCGATICTKCENKINYEDTNEYICLICEETHLALDKNLPINEIIFNLLLVEPDEVSRGKNVDMLKTTLDVVLNKINSIKFVIDNSADRMDTYCSDLENEVQLAKEQHILAVEEYSKKLLDTISLNKQEYKKKCELSETVLTDNLNEFLSELETFYDDWTSYLSNSIVDDEFINEVNETGKKLIEKADEEQSNLEKIIFKTNFLKFKKGEMKRLDLVIGKLEYEPNDLNTPKIVSCREMIDLFELCEFSFSNKWKLIYRGSDDGFSANDFHFKCDYKKNTLIIIKSTSGNVFGGYTSQDWSGSGYKSDLSAFVFSYKNGFNKPIKLKCAEPTLAISCHQHTGPTFGAGHDLFISNNCNTNHSSYANLCHSFKHPDYAYNTFEAKTFLADSYTFMITEIEVYSKE